MDKLPKTTDPIIMGSLKVKNRLVTEPLKNRVATDKGFVNPRQIDYYVEKGQGRHSHYFFL